MNMVKAEIIVISIRPLLRDHCIGRAISAAPLLIFLSVPGSCSIIVLDKF